MPAQPVLIDGIWMRSEGAETFAAVNPRTKEEIPHRYPISPWYEVEKALFAADRAVQSMRGWPAARFADFLESYATKLESIATELVEVAQAETGLAASPRLKDVELVRTTNQLRQAAAAARDGTWVNATIDTKTNIRSCFGPIGPVAVFGPNNFPFAYNGIAGGDFASAVAAGNPVIAKAHPLHPTTSRMMAEQAQKAADETNMPPGFVQMVYGMSHEDGLKFVAHPLLGAVGFTGGRATGLKLKEAADRVGKPIYLELSSINPVCLLPGALAERGSDIVKEFATSCLMATGQFCTNPGLVLTVAGEPAERFIRETVEQFDAAPTGILLGEGVQKNFVESVKKVAAHGAELLCGGVAGDGGGYTCRNTLLRVSGRKFLAEPEAMQTEAFGNGSLVVVAEDQQTLLQVIGKLEGNLTASVYSAKDGGEDALAQQVSNALRPKVGRLLNDKMPTGVAVVPSMNHGGPFPATGHPGFTAVGFPASIHRFAMLHCYDNVRPHRLPPCLQDENPNGTMWRLIDGQWTQGPARSAS